jgi:hypothetical protein
MKNFFVLLGALALAACQTPIGPISPFEAPAPLAKTTVDDSGLQTAWRSFDLALDGIALLRDAGALKPGTPKAIAVANGIDKVLAAFEAAEHAVAAGSTTSYRTAMAEAKAAVASLRSVLRSN